MSDVHSTSAASKRRNPNPCDLCRKKKIKCDSESMHDKRCSECVNHNCECIRSGTGRMYKYGAPSLPRTSSVPSLASNGDRSFPDDTSALHPLVAAAIPLLPSGLSPAGKGAIVSISSHIINLERQLSELRTATASNSSVFTQPETSTVYPSPNSTTSSKSSDEDEAAELAEKLTELHVQPWGPTGKTFGPTSNLTLLRMALKVVLGPNKDSEIIQKFRSLRRPFFWNFLPWEAELHEDLPIHEFPPAPLMADLIELYFHEVNPFIPLLHKPTFMKAIQENQHIFDPRFGEVVLGVCALGSRWSFNPAVLLEADNLGHSAGWRWFRQIRLFRKAIVRSPSVFELQTIVLSAFYMAGSSQAEIGWTLLGLGIRLAVDTGAHRKRGPPSVESELWKRAFWTIWTYEGLVSSFLGRPRATTPDDFDVDMPIDCDDEYWETEDPEQAFKQPPGKPSGISAFICFIKLIQISDFAQGQLFSVKAQKALLAGKIMTQDVVAELDSKLNQWTDSVPNHLQWENYQNYDIKMMNRLPLPLSTFYRQSAMLHCIYHNLQMLAHRPFIFFSKPDAPMFVSSWAICTNSARASMRILRVWQPFMIAHFSLMSNAVMALLEKWMGPKTTNAMTARERVLECVAITRTFENRWFGSGKKADVLAQLLYLDDLVSNSHDISNLDWNSPQLSTDEIIFGFFRRDAAVCPPEIDMDFLGREFVDFDEGFPMTF